MDFLLDLPITSMELTQSSHKQKQCHLSHTVGATSEVLDIGWPFAKSDDSNTRLLVFSPIDLHECPHGLIVIDAAQ
jgi:hypothetical protein